MYPSGCACLYQSIQQYTHHHCRSPAETSQHANPGGTTPTLQWLAACLRYERDSTVSATWVGSWLRAIGSWCCGLSRASFTSGFCMGQGASPCSADPSTTCAGTTHTGNPRALCVALPHHYQQIHALETRGRAMFMLSIAVHSLTLAFAG